MSASESSRTPRDVFCLSFESSAQREAARKLKFGVNDLTITGNQQNIKITAVVERRKNTDGKYRRGEHHKNALHICVKRKKKAEVKKVPILMTTKSCTFRGFKTGTQSVEIHTSKCVLHSRALLRQLLTVFRAFFHTFHFDFKNVRTLAEVLEVPNARRFKAITLYNRVNATLLKTVFRALPEIRLVNFLRNVKYVNLSKYRRVTGISIENGSKITDAQLIAMKFESIKVEKCKITPQGLKTFLEQWEHGKRKTLKRVDLAFKHRFPDLELLRRGRGNFDVMSVLNVNDVVAYYYLTRKHFSFMRSTELTEIDLGGALVQL
ncbi:unnamed protein product [Caenorhabditis sp. 36 PRJEB53466]|nr:unnamed protein product [Caenorhabditis sp. 36 PRJEB53466]